MRPYRLRHKKTGLYYATGTLSEYGKVYRHNSNFCTYLGKEKIMLRLAFNGPLHTKYKEKLDELDWCKGKRGDRYPENTPVCIFVHSEDFEKEFLE